MCGSLLLLTWLLIFRKNHTLTVEGSSIRDTNFMTNRVCATVESREIRSVRRNLLGEWLLKDENGKTLIRVESNMSERDLLKAWLSRRGLTVD